MGKRLFKAARVAQAVRSRLSSPIVPRMNQVPPPWLSVVEAIPPADIVTRTIPTTHHAPDPKMHKPRRTYRPQKMVYEEDELRMTFFRDHPWELARPRVMVELDGLDARRYDWSQGLLQQEMALCGESVVQRQLWLMHNADMSKEEAYNKARREFYTLRHQEEVERRIAQEEARMVGAYFGKPALQVGMELEDKTYEDWKKWAANETAKIEAERSQAYISFGTETPESEAIADGDQASGTPI